MITGTSGDDTFLAGKDTLQAGDTLDGGAGTDTLKIYEGQSISGVSITNIENIILNGYEGASAAAATFDFAGMTGLETIVLDGYGGAAKNHTFSNLGDGVAVALKGSVSGISNATKELTLGFTGTTGGIALDNMDGDKTGSFVRISGDALKELTVSGTAAMKNGLPQTNLSLNETASNLETLVVNADKDGFISLDVNTAFTKLAAIDASGSQGQTRFDIEHVTSTKLDVTGGAGNDTLRIKAAQLNAVTFDGGLGHDRAIVKMNNAAPTTAQYKLINNLGAEEIIFEGQGSTTLDAGKLDAHYIGVEDSVTVTNLTADDYVVHSREDNDGITSTGFVVKTAVGNGTVNLILEKSLAASASSNDAVLSASSVFKTLNITGDGEQLTYENTAITKDLTINGADFAGKMIISTYTGDDAIIAGSGGSTITGGAGDDVITLGAGVDTVVFSASSNGVDTLIGFTAGAGGDVLDFKAFFGTASNANLVAVVAESSTGSITVTSKDILRVTDAGAAMGATDVAALFGSGKVFAAPSPSNEYVLVTDQGNVWCITAGSSSVSSANCIQVGTLGAIGLESLDTANFA